ncbi:uncharacterized protein LOC132936744 isoform X3 [Metopolophium dirhodum]|uniref:uncharacterized protein LOC132936744 isoform X3 n=1 Tax=Metopolophium dirhodum TaxID=44670 RepID=UPI00298F96A6|nr:uncharacterized protein LOC132936744 isoform X3 [Metopolophium dirhodum]
MAKGFGIRVISSQISTQTYVSIRSSAFDQYSQNMVLVDAEETITTVEVDEETFEEVYKTTKRRLHRLILRGCSVLLVSLSTTTS